MELTAYTKVFFTEYNTELSALASEVDASLNDDKFKAIVRVACNLLKIGDYTFEDYVVKIVKDYFSGRFEYCDEIMNKVGYLNECVENPFITIYPETFVNHDFDVDGYCWLLTCIAESINNLIRKQKYTDNEVKKNLLNHRPINIVLRRGHSEKPLSDRGEFLIVARTYFQLISSSCFHSAKHGAYPLVLEHSWSQQKFYINGKGYSVKDLQVWYPELTWESTMTVIKGDKAKNLNFIYPANEIHISGDYEFYECSQSSLPNPETHQ